MTICMSSDRAADCVRIYEGRTGRHLRNLVSRSDQLNRPIHLLLSPDGRYLLIGSGGNDSILRHDLQQGFTSVFVEPKSGGLNGPAGMAFGDDGLLYVASRNTKEILRYDAKDGRPFGKPFIKNLAGQPGVFNAGRLTPRRNKPSSPGRFAEMPHL